MAHSDTGSQNNVTVSIVVLAYNESRNLPKTIDIIQQTMRDKFSAYEIIIVDDGSYDDTGRIADEIATADSHIKSIHNSKNMGCGYTFWHGARKARYQYIWLLPGDGEIPQISLETIVNAIGTADMIIPYMVNSGIRPLFRRLISWGYTSLLNILFRKHLHYYNGPAVFPAAQLVTAPEVHSTSFAFTAPIIISLMKRKVSYREVGILLKERDFGKPSLKNVLNIFGTLKIIGSMFWKINVTDT